MMTRRGLAATAIAVLVSPLPSRSQGALNDRLNGDITPVHDPCIIKGDDGLYHLFCTSQISDGKGLLTWRTSPDLVAWTFKGAVMSAFPDWVVEKLPKTRGAWAPDISFVNGKYLLYYAASQFGKNTSVIGLMTTPTLDTSRPDFGWTDEGLVVETVAGDDYNAIDPNHIVDAHGREWLALGSFWTGLKLVALDPATHKPKNGAKRISLAQRPKPDAVEGAFVIRKGEHYYLFASYDFCCRGVNSTYYTVVCRSRNVKGPYVDRDGKRMLDGGGTVILSADRDLTGRWKGPGHCAILQDGDTDYIVYHAYDAEKSGLPTLRIQKLNWTKDGWPQAV